MIKQPLIKAALALGALAFTPALSHAVGYEVHNTTESIAGTWASGNGDVLIGPSANIVVNGDWYITASNVYIHPSATITGTGTIHLMTPATYGQPSAATNLDAGGVAIGCKVSLENASTVVLTSINPTTAYPGSGITDPATAGSNDLVLANNLNFNAPGAHVVLGNYNVIFNSGTPTATYVDLNTAGFAAAFDPTTTGNAADAYLVTTGTGIVTKRGLATATAFNFPVGQSTTADYTPALVTNTSGAARDLSTQVKTYANSTSLEGNLTHGINRTWQITGSAAGTATVALTNNAATEGPAYNRNIAFVTQQVANGVWDVATGAAPTAPNYTHTRSALTVPTSGTTSYFSKSDDPTISISVNARLDAVVYLQGALALTGAPAAALMRNDLQNYFGGNTGILPTSDPYGLGATYASINDPSGPAGTVVDWVKVQIRDAVNPSTIYQTRALLLKPNGHIVDVDGSVPVFTGQTSSRAAIQHRNHMAILSLPIPTGEFRGVKSYDFTTSLSQAANAGDPAQMIAVNTTAGTKWCMWAGDIYPITGNDYFIDGNDRTALNASLGHNDETYLPYDINLDGFSDGNDKTILNSNLTIAPNSTLVNY